MSNWPPIASPVIAGNVAVVAFGRVDKGGVRMQGVKLGGKGDVTATHRVWRRDDVGAFVPTPSEYQGRVYVLSDRGQLDCIDPATGRTLWNEAFPRASSNFYASPLIVGGVMYAAREDGTVYVARVADRFELLSQHKFEDRIVASVVPVADRLFIRGAANLYCVAAR